MALEDDELQSIVCETSLESLKTDLGASVQVLKMLLCCLGSAYIVIDGVDEMNLEERERLVPQLISISKLETAAKILVSSRPEDDLRRNLEPHAATIRADQRNSDGIGNFIARRAKCWYLRRGFDKNAQSELNDLLGPLTSKSNGNCGIMNLVDGKGMLNCWLRNVPLRETCFEQH